MTDLADPLRTRGRNALIGLALGDALSWPALFHRSYRYPFWTRRLRREMDAAAEDTGVLRPQMPFSLNRSPDGFAPGPTDDTEWAAFLMRTLLGVDPDAHADASFQAWRALAVGDVSVRGSVSTQAALVNLRNDKEPPMSGHDNPHYFDDGACARSVPLGVLFAGRPEQAIRAAAAEASITNAQEGVWAAQAVAAGVAVACAGGNVGDLVEAACATLPADSWIDRIVARALDAADAAASMPELALLLAGTVVNAEYNYGTAAPETLGVALAVTQHAQGDLERGILGATAVPKAADAAVALAGAFGGALSPDISLSPSVADALGRLPGVCLPDLAGTDYSALVDAWVAQIAPPPSAT